jgi:hypothetical protein
MGISAHGKVMTAACSSTAWLDTVVSAYEMFQTLNKHGVDYDAVGLEWYPGLQVDF